MISLINISEKSSFMIFPLSFLLIIPNCFELSLSKILRHTRNKKSGFGDLKLGNQNFKVSRMSKIKEGDLLVFNTKTNSINLNPPYSLKKVLRCFRVILSTENKNFILTSLK